MLSASTYRQGNINNIMIGRNYNMIRLKDCEYEGVNLTKDEILIFQFMVGGSIKFYVPITDNYRYSKSFIGSNNNTFMMGTDIRKITQYITYTVELWKYKIIDNQVNVLLNNIGNMDFEKAEFEYYEDTTDHGKRLLITMHDFNHIIPENIGIRTYELKYSSDNTIIRYPFQTDTIIQFNVPIHTHNDTHVKFEFKNTKSYAFILTYQQ